MKRRRKDAESADFPPQLAEFNIDDWWVTDPEDPMEAEYARINWGVARRAFLAGEDWRQHLEPPAWWESRNN